MSDDEIMIMLVFGVAGGVGSFVTRVSSMPTIYSQKNPGIGLLRLAALGSVLWTAYVIQYHGDPSIVGIYVGFYLVMAYAVTKIFGQLLTAVFGLHLRNDVYERRNWAAAIFVAAFMLATGIIFGGSLWGEADPLSGDEGGWWIPLGFFLMGWAVLVLSTAVYLWREPGKFRVQIRQERDEALAWSVAVYVISTASLLLEGVAGDFWGWRHGVLGMGTIAVMLGVHEVIGFAGRSARPTITYRLVERILYVGVAAVAWGINRYVDRLFGGG